MYCNKCGNRLNNNAKFCSICASILFVLSAVIIFLGVIICFPDPNGNDSGSGLSFESFVISAGSMIIIGFILIILLVILNIVTINKNKSN